MATKALYILPHIHPFIHTPTAVSAMQSQAKLGLDDLLMDTSTLGQV